MVYMAKPPLKANNMGATKQKVVRKYGNKPTQAEYGGKVCNFRSQLEADVAKYLEMLKIVKAIKDWHYEQTTFKFDDPGAQSGKTRWLIDFDVLENDGSFYYIEVKGLLSGHDRRKLRLLLRERPEVRVMFVFKGSAGVKKLTRYKEFSKIWRVVTLRELMK
jgi:hypothetical protein